MKRYIIFSLSFLLLLIPSDSIAGQLSSHNQTLQELPWRNDNLSISQKAKKEKSDGQKMLESVLLMALCLGLAYTFIFLSLPSIAGWIFIGAPLFAARAINMGFKVRNKYRDTYVSSDPEVYRRNKKEKQRARLGLIIAGVVVAVAAIYGLSIFEVS